MPYKQDFPLPASIHGLVGEKPKQEVQPQRDPEVQRAVVDLGHELEDLEEVVEGLFDRLTPVSRPEVEVACADNAAPESRFARGPSPTASPLGAEIQKLQQQARAVKKRIQVAIARLEI